MGPELNLAIWQGRLPLLAFCTLRDGAVDAREGDKLSGGWRLHGLCLAAAPAEMPLSLLCTLHAVLRLCWDGVAVENEQPIVLLLSISINDPARLVMS